MMSACGFIAPEHVRIFLELNGVAQREPGQLRAKFLFAQQQAIRSADKKSGFNPQRKLAKISRHR